MQQEKWGHFKKKYDVNFQSRQIGSWYDDESWFVNGAWPWFARGDTFFVGTGAGIFDFSIFDGRSYIHLGYRIVLSI